MLLTGLPTELVVHIASNLRRDERTSLSRTCTTLQNALSPTNDGAWREIFARRYANRLSQPREYRSYHDLVRRHDTADDYLIHKRIPFHSLALPSQSSQSVAMLTTADAIHMGYGRKRYVFRRRDMSITSELSVECDATAVASGGRYTLTGLSNGAVQQHTSSGTCRILRGHKSAVTSLCTFEDRILASGSRDKTIRLRRLCDRRTQAILRGHDSAVEWTAVCEGRLATHGGCDGRAKLWDVTKGVCVTTGRPIQRATISRGVCHNGTIYVAIRNAVYVLDARMGLATACVLSMPRGSGWRDCDMSALRMCSDGTLLAGVGGGGVAVWDARGGWVARGLGWPRRWEEKKRMLRAVEMNGRTIVAGGDMGELLTFGRDGEYEGFVADDGVRRSGVSAIVGGEGKWLIARADGRVDVARVEEGVADWNVVAGVQEGSKSRFWDA